MRIIYPAIICLSLLSFDCYAAGYLFDDEFRGTSLSPYWTALDVYDNVNNELQCYTPSQITVSNGHLNINAVAKITRCAGSPPRHYASGAIVWAPGITFKYGTIEYRAEFAGGKGPWPAVWLLGYECQPDSPTVYNAPGCKWPQPGSNEIDITEIKHNNFTRPWQNVVNPAGDWTTCRPLVSDVTKNFHTYTFSWTPVSLTWYIDGVRTCQVTDPSYIPSTPMYMIINTSVGGDGGGTVIRSTLPQTTQVDYVRVTPYSQN